MSKTNDTSKPTTLEDHRPLADNELDAVSGGIWFLGYRAATNSVKQKPDGTSGGNVVGGWDLTGNKVHD
jgi:hypothetical protein